MEWWAIALIVLGCIALIATVVIVYLNWDYLKSKIDSFFEKIKARKEKEKAAKTKSEKKKIKKELKDNEKNKKEKEKEKKGQVAFFDCNNVVDKYIKKHEKEGKPLSIKEMEELDKEAKEKPYIAVAIYNGEIIDSEAPIPQKVEQRIKDKLAKEDGIIIIEE